MDEPLVLQLMKPSLKKGNNAYDQISVKEWSLECPNLGGVDMYKG